MTVFDNIAFGLTVLPRRERPNAAAIKAKVTKLLEMVQLATSDNPRTEEPQAILDAILPAVPNAFYVDVDRRTAIRAAVAEAKGPAGDALRAGSIVSRSHSDNSCSGSRSSRTPNA